MGIEQFKRGTCFDLEETAVHMVYKGERGDGRRE